MILTLVFKTAKDISKSYLEVLSSSSSLAAQHNMPSEVMLLGNLTENDTNILKKYGATKIHHIVNPFDNHIFNEQYVSLLSSPIKNIAPCLVTCPSNENVKNFIGMLGAACDANVQSDVIDISFTSDSRVYAKRPVMASKVVACYEISHPMVFATYRSGVCALKEQQQNTIEVCRSETVKPTLRQELLEYITSSGKKIDLADAHIVVAVGRGVKDDKGKALVEELAKLLGAAIGASRGVTESNMYDPSIQIGQTGKVVSPDLYIAIGISGAVQHVAGMINSKVIVAINKDADAPIFSIADYGLVGDLYTILPLLISQLRN